ncbi:MAG: hypothetical protein DRP93_00185 [Candidatus Neomarinimicrobiota bacterium]|nr:MAG: hypothetical protein DRP93_00185 [Candidatus Neomarinimicrobiota bacterium]
MKRSTKRNPVYQINNDDFWGMKIGDKTAARYKFRATGRDEIEGMLCFLHRTKRQAIAKEARRMLKKDVSVQEVREYIDNETYQLEHTLLNPLHTMVYCSHKFMMAGDWKEAAAIAKTLAEYTHSKAPTEIVSDITEHTYSSQDLDAKLAQLTSDLSLIQDQDSE